jgi:hypothetical protein
MDFSVNLKDLVSIEKKKLFTKIYYRKGVKVKKDVSKTQESTIPQFEAVESSDYNSELKLTEEELQSPKPVSVNIRQAEEEKLYNIDVF